MREKMRIKNVINIIACSVLMLIAVFIVNTELIYAAGATVSISSSDVTQGNEFEVIVNIKADANIGAYNFYIDYDADIIEAVSGFNGGGNGRIQLIYYVPNTDVKKDVTAKIKFKAKKPGTTSIKYVSISDDNGVIDFDTTDNMNVTATTGSVTVKAPYVASKDNYLTNLKVEAVKSDGSTYTLDLSPKFSKDVTKYNAKAVEGVTKLVLTAEKSDSKATIKMTGRAMDPGDNTTTITVTAENGSTRKYVIYTYVEKKPETTTPPPEPIKVQIDGTDYHIDDIDNNVKLPEGFEKFDYQYKGEKVVAAKGLVKNLIVMYVTKSDGSDGKLYIYEESNDRFYPMSNLQLTQKLYTIVTEPNDLIIPSGFTETTVIVDEQNFKGWSNSEVENIYLVYAMNWNGERGLYYYDANEKQIIRYFDVSVEVGGDVETNVGIDDYNNLLSDNETLRDEINKLKADNNKDDAESVKLYKYLALGACIMAAVYLGIIIFLVVSKKKKQTEVTEKTDDENELSVEEKQEESDVEDLAENASITTTMTGDESEEKSIEEESTEEESTEEESTEEFSEDIKKTEDEEMPMDFEDIITNETVSSIVDEKELEENVELADEITPQVSSTQVEHDATADIATEKKKKVAEIMGDDDSSINKDDLDMVIDELFDDLFD